MHSLSLALCAARHAEQNESCRYQRTLGGIATDLPLRRRTSNSSSTAAAHESRSAPTLAAALRRACTFLRSSSSSPREFSQSRSQSAKCWTKSPRACHHNSGCPSIRSTAAATLNPLRDVGIRIKVNLSANQKSTTKKGKRLSANCHSKNICKNMQMVKQFKGFTLDYNHLFSDLNASNLCAKLRSLSKTIQEHATFSAPRFPPPASIVYSPKTELRCGANSAKTPTS